MPETRSFCCWKTAKEGCVACGLYTLIFYLIKMSVASYHISLVTTDTVYLSFAILVCVLSSSCVLSSILLFIGIFTNNRTLLVPWMCSLSLTTLTDVIMCFYMFTQASYNPVLGVVFIVDVFICSLNVYCLLCVSSRYQELSLELYTTKFEDNQRAISLHHQGSIKVRTIDSSLNKSTALIDNGSSLGVQLLSSSQRKGTASPKNQLLTELSTISEEQSFSNFNRKPSTDVSFVGLDIQILSPSSSKQAFSANSPSPAHSIELYSEVGNETTKECLSFSTKDGYLCPPNTGNELVFSPQFELVNFTISEEPPEYHF